MHLYTNIMQTYNVLCVLICVLGLKNFLVENFLVKVLGWSSDYSKFVYMYVQGYGTSNDSFM